MKFRIVSDSSSDIFALSEVDFATVPLKVITDEKEYIDTPELDVDEMISDLQKYKGTSKSSCPNMEDWRSAFGDAEAVFCVPITRNLSGSYNSATLACEEYVEEHPDRKAYVVDTLSAGPGCAILVEKLCALIAEGLSFEEIRDNLCEYQRSTHLHFCLESLRNFANNGRVSHATAKIAGVIGIRIIGMASDEGTLEVQSKARGAAKAISEMYSKLKEYGYCGGKVRIHHCHGEDTAEALSRMILADYPDADIAVRTTGALCSFYAEEGGFLVGYEGRSR